MEVYVYPLMAIFAIVFVTYLLVWRKKEEIDYSKKVIKRVEEIPRHYHLGKWAPTFLEGMYTCYLIRKEGVNGMAPFVKKYGRFFEIAFLTETVIQVQDTDLIQKLLSITDYAILNKARFIYDYIFIGPLRNGLISSEPEIWNPHRKMASKCFTYKALPTYLDMINKHASGLINDCPEDYIDGDKMYNVLSTHSIKIVSEIVLGADSQPVKESEALHHDVQTLKGTIAYKVLHNPANMFYPFWWLNLPKRIPFDRASLNLRRIILGDIQKQIKETEENKILGVAEKKKGFRSLIEEMLSHGATTEEVYDEAASFIIAGHDTLVSVINFFIQLMGENQECQRKAQEEIDELFREKKEKGVKLSLTMDDLQKLNYLERCITETLRLGPPTPVFFRTLSADLSIETLDFKKGTTFAFSPWTLHRDPRYYPEPERYDPDRWLPEEKEKRPACSFLAFSHGPRNCIGKKVAMMEMMVFLAWMLHLFDIETADKFYDIKIWSDATVNLERNYNVTLKKRVKD